MYTVVEYRPKIKMPYAIFQNYQELKVLMNIGKRDFTVEHLKH